MMTAILEQSTITREQEATELNLQSLYQEGLEHIRQWSKHIWTDFNTHDPGVTTLEVLCYALTDLSYRASLPIADLLASPTDNASNMAEQFFTARQILTNKPLTELDYRKLLIDLPGIKNAWLKPVTQTYYADFIEKKLAHEAPDTAHRTIKVTGLYNVLLDFNKGLTDNQKKTALNKVKSTLHANRNLCEDFRSFEAVEECDFRLCCDIEIEKNADANEVKAQVLFQVQNYLAPAVNNYRLSEVLSKTKADGSPYHSDDIFNGPALNTGFILDEELSNAELRSEIYLSDIINILMDISGIKAVKELLINPDSNDDVDRWVIAVPEGKKAILDTENSRIVLHKGIMPIATTAEQVESHLDQLLQQQQAQQETITADDLAIPLGQFRSPADYHSLQHDFPAAYGLGEEGIPAGIDKQHAAKVMQLRGYLLFIEQIIANYFAQLSHLKELFSNDAQITQSYFYQTVTSFNDWQKTYAVADPVATMHNDIEDKATILDRRSRFLDHLIGRFSEQFSDLAHTMYSAFVLDDSTINRYKSEFLQQYPILSSERGQAYNYSLKTDQALWDSDNISGLERRIASLLGMRNPTRRNLSSVSYDIYAEIDTTPDDEFRFRVRHRQTMDILLSSSTNYVTKIEAEQAMVLAIFHASDSQYYQRKITINDKHYFNIIDDEGQVVARRIEYFTTVEEMESNISALIDYLHVAYSDEGMYLIENLLLRPSKEDDPFMPICVDSDCDECSELDPYSYRIHIILPAYTKRFLNQDFRSFAESVIRAEVPAHILPTICWINQQDMASLEAAYRAWLSIQANRTRANRSEIIATLINNLMKSKNIYPDAKLHDCSDTSGEDKFVLNHTVLGSLSNATANETDLPETDE